MPLPVLDALARLLAPGYITESQFEAVMSYIAQAGRSASLFVFFRRLARKVPQHKETLMTIAEWMEKEREKGIDFGRRLGMNKGRREGIKDGLRRGLREGLDKGQREGERNAKRQISQALLATGIDVAIIAKTTGLTVAEIEALA
ncbi:RpnC/YadD family protein [Pseudocitrobacter cyperus]|uniref:Transposase n=1 Tax=Pseudocitrobacter cyperus TaxID=3112843 RepID=A0ABV0HJ49_9ENTR